MAGRVEDYSIDRNSGILASEPGFYNTPASVLGRRLPPDGRRHEYVYIACELFSDVPIAQLPLRNVQFSWARNKPGTFSAELPVPVFSRVRDYLMGTTPGRSVVYVFRDGVPIWGGIIWKRSFSSESRIVKIEGDTFDSYMYHRVLDQDLIFLMDNKNPGTDQIKMFHILWAHMSGNWSEAAAQFNSKMKLPLRQNADIKVILRNWNDDTILRGRTFSKWDFRTYGEHLETLASLRNGFEWYATVAQAPIGTQSVTGVQRVIEFGYPKFGRSFLETGFIWEYPANALSYSWNSDADGSATAVYILGAGEGDLKAYAVSYNHERLDEGWPLIDVAKTHSTVVRRETMLAHAAKYLRALDPPVGTFDLTIHPDMPPTFGPPGTEQYFIGDEIGVKIEDDIFLGADVRPDDLYVVIDGIQVTPNDDGIEDVKPEISVKSRNPYIAPDEEEQNDLVPPGWPPGPAIDDSAGAGGARSYYVSGGGHMTGSLGTGGWGGSRP